MYIVHSALVCYTVYDGTENCHSEVETNFDTQPHLLPILLGFDNNQSQLLSHIMICLGEVLCGGMCVGVVVCVYVGVC